MAAPINAGAWRDFLKEKAYLESKGYDFETKIKGNVATINVNGRSFRYIDRDKVSANSGYHLSKMVMNDVDKLVTIDEDTPFMDAMREQIFEIDNCKANIGKDGIAIDITNCYWITARRLNIISERTFIKGLKKAEWKKGRNASIGSLAARTIIKSYVRGKHQRKQNIIIEPQPHREYARYLVLKYVFETFMEIINLLGNDFCFYLTDCIFLTQNYKAVKEVYRILQSRGYYEAKSFNYQLIDVMEDEKQIHWIDFSKTVESKRQKKYYKYSETQLLEKIAR